MNSSGETIRIHMADDDPDDRLLLSEAMEDAKVENPLDFTVDGEDLMRYLRREGEYEGLQGHPLPDLLLLDLNMPRKDGRECIAEIRGDESLKHIPIVVLTTSQADEDVLASYRLGVNSFITKPVTFDKLVETVRTMAEYWIRFVRLPSVHS